MKLLVSDFDGTFYTDDDQVKRNVEAIHEWQEKGNTFMLSSGRSYESLKDKIDTYHIPYDFISSEDGSHLFDTQNLLFETIMSPDIYPEIEELISLGVHKDFQIGTTYAYLSELPEEDSISSINFGVRRDQITPEFRKEWKKIKRNKQYSFLEYGYKEMVFFCIKPIGINKSTPIHFLKETLPLPKSQIFTVGDNDNDKCMIEDFNGYRIGTHRNLRKVILDTYPSVEALVTDIEKQKVKTRW